MALGLYHSNFWQGAGGGPTSAVFLTAMSRVIGPVALAFALVALEAVVR